MMPLLSPVYVHQSWETDTKEIVGVAFHHPSIPNGQTIRAKLVAISAQDGTEKVALLDNGDRFVLGYYTKF